MQHTIKTQYIVIKGVMSDFSKLYTTNSYGFDDEWNHQNNLKKHSMEDVLNKERTG